MSNFDVGPFLVLSSVLRREFPNVIRGTDHPAVGLLATETIAGRIISAATFGERDPIRLRIAGLRKADKRGG